MIAVRTGRSPIRPSAGAFDALLAQARAAAARQPRSTRPTTAPTGRSQIAPLGADRVRERHLRRRLRQGLGAGVQGVRRARDAAQPGSGVEFEVEGQIAENANRRARSAGLQIGFAAAAVVLFLVFGSLLATMLPLLTAGVSLGVGIAVVGLLSNVIDDGLVLRASCRC